MAHNVRQCRKMPNFGQLLALKILMGGVSRGVATSVYDALPKSG